MESVRGGSRLTQTPRPLRPIGIVPAGRCGVDRQRAAQSSGLESRPAGVGSGVVSSSFSRSSSPSSVVPVPASFQRREPMTSRDDAGTDDGCSVAPGGYRAARIGDGAGDMCTRSITRIGRFRSRPVITGQRESRIGRPVGAGDRRRGWGSDDDVEDDLSRAVDEPGDDDPVVAAG